MKKGQYWREQNALAIAARTRRLRFAKYNAAHPDDVLIETSFDAGLRSYGCRTASPATRALIDAAVAAKREQEQAA